MLLKNHSRVVVLIIEKRERNFSGLVLFDIRSYIGNQIRDREREGGGGERAADQANNVWGVMMDYKGSKTTFIHFTIQG